MDPIIRLPIIIMLLIFIPGRNIHADPASQHVGVSLHENMLNSWDKVFTNDIDSLIYCNESLTIQMPKKSENMTQIKSVLNIFLS